MLFPKYTANLNICADRFFVSCDLRWMLMESANRAWGMLVYVSHFLL